MKPYFTILIIILLFVGLSGCNSTSDTRNADGEAVEYNLGESVIVGSIKYTFLSVYWEESWDTYSYKLEIKGENIGNVKETSQISVKEYEMENGYRYSPAIGYGTAHFSINPGKNETETISCPEDSQLISGIDRDFLPVAKIYLEIGEIYQPSERTTIVLNV